MSDDIKPNQFEGCTLEPSSQARIEALKAENARLKTAIATHGAEACGVLRSYHQEDGTRLWLALRAALAQDNAQRDQGAGDQADDA